MTALEVAKSFTTMQAPSECANALRIIAERYRDDASELRAAWQDESAGKVWLSLARELDRAADRCDAAVKRDFP